MIFFLKKCFNSCSNKFIWNSRREQREFCSINFETFSSDCQRGSYIGNFKICSVNICWVGSLLKPLFQIWKPFWSSWKDSLLPFQETHPVLSWPPIQFKRDWGTNTWQVWHLYLPLRQVSGGRGACVSHNGEDQEPSKWRSPIIPPTQHAGSLFSC